MTDFIADNFLKRLILKNNLINAPISKLNEIYDDEIAFLYFINSLIELLNNESTFLLLDEAYIDKIFDIFMDKRFKFKDKDILNLVNSLIMELNMLKGIDINRQEELIRDYWLFNEGVRKIRIYDYESFINVLANDVVVYHALSTGDFSKVVLDDVFLSSITYLVNQNPNFFEDTNHYILTRCVIESYKHKGRKLDVNFKMYLKHLGKDFQKIKIREE